jgi:2-oxoisovalerate dehydrogenase E1 component
MRQIRDRTVGSVAGCMNFGNCCETLNAPIKVVNSEDVSVILLISILEETMIPSKERVVEAIQFLLDY